jgi:hypothetical protein
MTGERELATAAKRRTIDCGDNRLRGGFNFRQDVRKGRLDRLLAEFSYVSPGTKELAGSGHDNRSHLGLGSRSFHCLDEATSETRGEGIHRRCVECDDSDVVNDGIAGQGRSAVTGSLIISSNIPYNGILNR